MELVMAEAPPAPFIKGHQIMRHLVLAASALALALASPAHAGTATGTLPIAIQSPLQIVFTPANPQIPCNAPTGTKVAAISTTGGTGNPVTFTASAGDTSDFAVSGTNVVVGPNAIAAANCGSTQNIQVTASQP
jgi:hypothetical protein